MSQNQDRIEILHAFKEKFDCGTIRPDRSDKTYKYEIRSIQKICEKVIPHFRDYPLQSGKSRDFELFAEICEIMRSGEHLTRQGLRRIIDLAFEMNASGKRKYVKDEMKI